MRDNLKDDYWDIRPWLERVQAGRHWIIGAALLALLLSLVRSLLDPQPYRAEAVLALARPAAAPQFDERFRSPELGATFPARVASIRVYPELILRDAMVAEVAELLQEQDVGDTDGDPDLDALRERVELKVLADGSLIRLRAVGEDPADAAELANLWAETAVHEMRGLFEESSALSSIREAEVEALEEWDAAEREIEELMRDRSPLALKTEVESAELHLRRLRNAEQLGRSAMDDLRMLQEAGAEAGLSQSLMDIFALISLGSARGEGEAGGFEILLSGEGPRLGADDPEALRAALEARIAELGSEISRQENLLTERSADLQSVEAEQQLLISKRDGAKETYEVLARKAEELSIAERLDRPELRLASPALPDDDLPLRDWVLSALIASLAGAVLGVLFCLILPRRRA